MANDKDFIVKNNARVRGGKIWLKDTTTDADPPNQQHVYIDGSDGNLTLASDNFIEFHETDSPTRRVVFDCNDNKYSFGDSTSQGTTETQTEMFQVSGSGRFTSSLFIDGSILGRVSSNGSASANTGNSHSLLNYVFLNPSPEAGGAIDIRTVNELAGLNTWGTISAVSGFYTTRTDATANDGDATNPSYTYSNPVTSTASTIGNMFDGVASTGGSWYTDNGTGGTTAGTGTFTLSFAGKKELDYTCYVGIVFGSASFTAKKVKIEVYRGGTYANDAYSGGNWETLCDLTNNSDIHVSRKVATSSSVGVQQIKYTLGANNTATSTYFRVQDVYALDHDAGGNSGPKGIHYVRRYGDSNIYGNILPAIDSTYTLGSSSQFFLGVYSDKLYLNNVAATATGTSALFLDGTEVKKRTLGSLAFSSTNFLTADANDTTNAKLTLNGANPHPLEIIRTSAANSGILFQNTSTGGENAGSAYHTAYLGLGNGNGQINIGTAADVQGTGNRITTVADKLNVFASTTSAELAGKISDETGSGALVFATNPSLVGFTSTGAVVIDVDDVANGALRITANQRNPSNDFYFAQEIISTLQDADPVVATGGDREQGGLYIDVNSTVTGGDVSDEHRAYGIYVDVDSTGDSDLVYGGNFYATATPSVGTTTEIVGLQGNAEDNGGAGAVSYVRGVKGQAFSDNATSDINTMEAGHFRSYTYADSGTVGNVRGIHTEIEIAPNTGDVHGNSAVVYAQYDNNSDTPQTNTTSLFQGLYSGQMPSTAYGINIQSDAESRFTGKITTKQGAEATPGYSFWADADTGMYGPALDELGLVTNGSKRLHLTNAQATFENLDNGVKISGTSTAPSEALLSIEPGGSSTSGAGTAALQLKNSADTSFDADGLTSYNATTGYDIIDKTAYTIHARPKRSSIHTHSSSVTGEPVSMHRIVNFDENADGGGTFGGMYAMHFYQYDGSGAGTAHLKKPVGKLFSIHTYESSSTQQQLAINSDGDVHATGTVRGAKVHAGAAAGTTNADIEISNNDSSTLLFHATDTTIAANADIGRIEFKTADTTTTDGQEVQAQIKAIASTVDGGGELIFSTSDTTSGDNNDSVTERMRIQQDGKVGIGVSDCTHELQVSGIQRIEGQLMVGNSGSTNEPASDCAIHIKNTGVGARLRIEDSDSSNDFYDLLVDQGDAFYITKGTNGPELKIDNNGLFQMKYHNTTGSNVDPVLRLLRTGNTADNDNLGEIQFYGNNDGANNGGTVEEVKYASIQAKVLDESDASEDGQLEFEITSSGSTTATALRMTATEADFTSSHIKAGSLRLRSANAGATEGPELALLRDSSSPADNDLLGVINFKAHNDADEETVFAKILAKATDVSNGTEDSNLEFHTIRAGASGISARLESNKLFVQNHDDATEFTQIFPSGFVMSPGADIITDRPTQEFTFQMRNKDEDSSVFRFGDEVQLAAYGLRLLPLSSSISQIGEHIIGHRASGDFYFANLDKIRGKGNSNYYLDLRYGGDISRIPHGLVLGSAAQSALELRPYANGHGSIGASGIKWNTLHVNTGNITTLFLGSFMGLGDSKSIGFGDTTGGDARFFYDGTNNHLELEMESDSVLFKITDNGDSRFTFIKSSGEFTASGNITAFSDQRLKTEVKTLDPSKTLQMRGVEFIKDGKKGSGVIAQELEKVAPELVLDNDSGYKSVAYGNLTGYLIETVKEQQKQIDELKELVQKLLEK